ncbi:MAG: M24 family metallopeptidase [Nannocystaceae bacterium]
MRAPRNQRLTPRRSFLAGAAAIGGAWLSGCASRCIEFPTRPPQLDAQLNPQSGSRPVTASKDVPTYFPELHGFCDGVAEVSAYEREQRWARAQKLLADAGLGALIVEAGPTHGYFAPTTWRRSERPLLMVLPASGPPIWVGPAFEEGRIVEKLGHNRVLTWQEDASPYARAGDALRSAGVAKSATVGVDPDARGFVIAGLRGALGARRVVLAGEVVDGCRMVKTAPELDRLRRANEATKAALQAAAQHLTPGMHEDTFADLVREAQMQAGLRDIWALVLFGPNASFPHGTDERRPLHEGELVLVDTGGSLHGYRSDITRTWAIGSIPDNLRTAWETVLTAQTAALAKIRPGASCAEVDGAARQVITQAGYGTGFEQFTHRLGHGIGLQVHERPYLRPANPRVLKPGMTMSNEPGIYVPGAFGVRIEDIVAVTADGVEVFGPRAKSLEAPFG